MKRITLIFIVAIIFIIFTSLLFFLRRDNLPTDKAPTTADKCVDSNEQCQDQPDGTECNYGIWCDSQGNICGGQSCVGLGLGKCVNGKCELTK